MGRIAGAADGLVGDRREVPVGAARHRPERLEPRPGALDVVGEEERPLPEALASDRRVGLPVDGQQEAAAGGVLRHPLHHHHHVPVRIGVDRPRAQRLLLQRDRIVVGGVVVERGPRAARLDVISHEAQERSDGAERILPGGRILVAEEARAARWTRVGAAVAVPETETAAPSSRRNRRAENTAGRRSRAWR